MKKMRFLPILAFLLTLTLLSGCVSFKQQALFDKASSRQEPAGIDGFYGLNIYDDAITYEIWYTKSPNCLRVERVDSISFAGSSSMLWKWDKDAGGCPWMGIGFGWDAWSPKDISPIADNAAVRMMVRSTDGKLMGLPLAAAFEDYSGNQAWLGLSSNTIQGGVIDDEGWTSIILPLAEFNWDENDASMTNIKQFSVQFEAAGSLLVDDIRIVPYDGGFRKRLNSQMIDSESLNEENFKTTSAWKNIEPLSFDGHEVRIIAGESHFFIKADVSDDDPLLNFQEGDNILNGDAFEMAFSSAPDKPSKRIRYKSTDQHFALRVSDKPMAWNLRKHERIEGVVIDIQKSATGFTLYAAMPYCAFDMEPIEESSVYGLELAIDDGDKEGKRVKQSRWNNPSNDSFNRSPSAWGEMIFEKDEN